jgi:hypothetical protein
MSFVRDFFSKPSTQYATYAAGFALLVMGVYYSDKSPKPGGNTVVQNGPLMNANIIKPTTRTPEPKRQPQIQQRTPEQIAEAVRQATPEIKSVAPTPQPQPQPTPHPVQPVQPKVLSPEECINLVKQPRRGYWNDDEQKYSMISRDSCPRECLSIYDQAELHMIQQQIVWCGNHLNIWCSGLDRRLRRVEARIQNREQ